MSRALELADELDIAARKAYAMGVKELREAAALLRSLHQDAERYRWLRHADDVPLLREACDTLTGEALDAALDAAIDSASERKHR